MVQRAPLNNRLLSPCYFYTWTTCYFYRYFYTILFILFMSFPGGSVGKEFACNAGNLGSIPELGRSGEGNGYQLPYDSLTFLKLSPLHSILTHVLNSEFVPGPVPGAGEITDDKVQPWPLKSLMEQNRRCVNMSILWGTAASA